MYDYLNITKEIPQELANEMQIAFPDTSKQPKPLCYNMAGEIATAQNFLLKIASDFLIDFNKSSYYYKPQLDTPYINFIAGFKVVEKNAVNGPYKTIEKTVPAWHFIFTIVQRHESSPYFMMSGLTIPAKHCNTLRDYVAKKVSGSDDICFCPEVLFAMNNVEKYIKQSEQPNLFAEYIGPNAVVSLEPMNNYIGIKYEKFLYKQK